MKRNVLAVTAALVLGSGPALAASATANLSVTASIANVCTISTSVLGFGPYDPVTTNAATALTGSGTVVITCTKNAATTVGLGLGANAAGAVRRMTDGAASFMTYEAYQPPNNTPGSACSYAAPTVWGTAGANLFTPAVAPSKAARTYNVCGSVAAGQDLPAGAYTDTVVATVNF